MKVFIKSLNSCVMRKRNILHYRDFIIANSFAFVSRKELIDIGTPERYARAKRLFFIQTQKLKQEQAYAN